MQANKKVFEELKKKHDKLGSLLTQEKLNDAEINLVITDIKNLNEKLVDSRLQEIVSLRKIVGPKLFKEFDNKMKKNMKMHFGKGKHPEKTKGSNRQEPPQPPREF